MATRLPMRFDRTSRLIGWLPALVAASACSAAALDDPSRTRREAPPSELAHRPGALRVRFDVPEPPALTAGTLVFPIGADRARWEREFGRSARMRPTRAA